MTTLGVTGQRPYTRSVLEYMREYGFTKTHKGVAWYHEQGFDTVVSGMAMGVDQWAAAAALRWGMRLVAALPFPQEVQSARWDAEAKARYTTLVDAADEVWTAADHFSMAAYANRNQWIVDRADAMLVVTNGQRRGGTWDCIGRIVTAGTPGVLVQTKDRRVIPFGNGTELATLLDWKAEVAA